MTRKIGLSLTFVLVCAFVFAPQASACYFGCVERNGCERCEYVGHFTGGYCENSGSCSCLDVQDVCWGAQADGNEQAAFPGFEISPLAAVCSTEPLPGAPAPTI